MIVACPVYGPAVRPAGQAAEASDFNSAAPGAAVYTVTRGGQTTRCATDGARFLENLRADLSERLGQTLGGLRFDGEQVTGVEFSTAWDDPVLKALGAALTADQGPAWTTAAVRADRANRIVSRETLRAAIGWRTSRRPQVDVRGVGDEVFPASAYDARLADAVALPDQTTLPVYGRALGASAGATTCALVQPPPAADSRLVVGVLAGVGVALVAILLLSTGASVGPQNSPGPAPSKSVRQNPRRRRR